MALEWNCYKVEKVLYFHHLHHHHRRHCVSVDDQYIQSSILNRISIDKMGVGEKPNQGLKERGQSLSRLTAQFTS